MIPEVPSNPQLTLIIYCFKPYHFEKFHEKCNCVPQYENHCEREMYLSCVSFMQIFTLKRIDLKVSSDNLQVFVQCDSPSPRNGMWGKRGIMGGGGCLFEACPQKR